MVNYRPIGFTQGFLEPKLSHYSPKLGCTKNTGYPKDGRTDVSQDFPHHSLSGALENTSRTNVNEIIGGL